MPTIATSYFKRMSPAQLAAVQHIHIFANRTRLTAKDPGQYISYSAFAELGSLRGKKGRVARGERGACGIGGPYPRTMTITISKVDWNFRNHFQVDLEKFLRNKHWENVLGELKELRMELEVEDEEKEVLVPIINKLKNFEFNIGGGGSLVAGKEVKESVWKGGLIERPLGGPQPFTWRETKFHVVTVVWRVRSVGQGLAD